MTKQEFGQWVMALRTYYPREKLLPNSQAVDLWYEQLQDIPYNMAEISLNKWVATNKWSPSISDIRELSSGIVTGEIRDWGDAWESVIDAVRLYGTYEIPEAMASFDELTREVVKRIGFRTICMSENIATERANFRMIYEELAKRKKEDSQIPERLQQAISKLNLGIEDTPKKDYEDFKKALEELGKEF